MDTVTEKIEYARNYWKSFDGEKQQGIAYGLELALSFVEQLPKSFICGYCDCTVWINPPNELREEQNPEESQPSFKEQIQSTDQLRLHEKIALELKSEQMQPQQSAVKPISVEEARAITERKKGEEQKPDEPLYSRQQMETAILQSRLVTKITVHDRYQGEDGLENLTKDILDHFHTQNNLIREEQKPDVSETLDLYNGDDNRLSLGTWDEHDCQISVIVRANKRGTEYLINESEAREIINHLQYQLTLLNN